MLKFARKLEAKNAKLIISSPTPEWHKDITFPLNKSSKIDKIFFDKEYKSIINFLERIEKQNKNIYILNSLSALCPNDICKYSTDNKILYRDTNHLSNYAARNIIGPILFELINKI